jgi:GntR family transcriptional repressor for pyruvate dehydrogenase complex
MLAAFHPLAATDKLSEQVARKLMAEIRSGRLAPQDKLPTEAVLVQQFGVSRTVIREAISQLKSLGLVASRQGSGMFVRAQSNFEPLSFEVDHAASHDAIVQLTEVRRAIEAESAGLAAERRTAKDLAHIRKALRAIDLAVQAGRDGVEEDMGFHHSVAVAAHNPFMLKTLDYLSQYLREGTRVTRANEARHTAFAEQVKHEHMAVYEAIEQGDPRAARKAATLHMQNASKRLKHADPTFWRQHELHIKHKLGIAKLTPNPEAA